MKIERFTATNVHDYINIDIRFNSDLSIMTGANGSGKTTAILLLQGILCPNFRDLLTIPFSTLLLSITHGSKFHGISVTNDGKHLRIRINTIEDVLEISLEKYTDIELISYRSKENIDLNEQIKKQLGPHPIINFIQTLPSPVFIGLDRTSDDGVFDREEYNYNLERRLYLTNERGNINKYKRQFKGTLGVGLLETEFLVQAVYKRLRAIEEKYTADLQEQIVLSSFDYISVAPGFENIANGYQERRQLLARTTEIEHALKRIGYGKNKDFADKLSLYFRRLADLMENTSPADGRLTIEWFTNYYQMEQLQKIVSLIDDYNRKILSGLKPIHKFLELINSFFADSGKSVYIDPVGHMFIKRPNGKDVPIDALSSGERQILILFANVMFNKNKNSSHSAENILLIDEPELSLHIKWQEKFIDTLLLASSNTQFILATHSPDIVGEHKAKCVRINPLSNNSQ